MKVYIERNNMQVELIRFRKKKLTLFSFAFAKRGIQYNIAQSITFEASDRSRSLPLALIHFLESELSLTPIREMARYKLCLSKR